MASNLCSRSSSHLRTVRVTAAWDPDLLYTPPRDLHFPQPLRLLPPPLDLLSLLTRLHPIPSDACTRQFMEDQKKDQELEGIPKTPIWDYNDRGQFQYLRQCQGNPEFYSPMDIALESDFAFWISQIKQMLKKLESLEAENGRLRSEVGSLTTKVSKVEGDNLSLKKMIEQGSSHPQNEVLHAEI